MKKPSEKTLKAMILSLRSIADMMTAMLSPESEDGLLPMPAAPVTEPQPAPRKGSGKATLGEVKAFCNEIGVPASDGEYMFHKFEADKWPKNWQAKIRSWKVGGFLPSQKASQFQKQPQKRTSV